MIATFALANLGCRAAESSALDSILLAKSVPATERNAITSFVKAASSGHEIDAVIAWAKADFPELRYEPGYSKVETGSFELGLYFTLDFFLQREVPEMKERMFFCVLDEWPARRASSYVPKFLELNALAYAAPKAVETRALAGLESHKEGARASAFRLAGVIALSDRALLQKVASRLEHETSESARLAFVDATAGLPTRSSMARDVAKVWVRSIADDWSLMVIDHSAELLRRSIARGDLKADDRGPILVALVTTSHSWRRTLLGRAAAALSLEKNFAVNDGSATDSVFHDFVKYYEKVRSTSELTPENITPIWEKWWETKKTFLGSKEELILTP
jgi:hypothetical protein